MPSDDLMEWLGPAREDLTDEQIDRILAEVAPIAARYPDADEQGERDAALSAVVQYLLGETTDEDARRTLIDARAAEDRAFAAASWIGVMMVRDGGEKKASADAVGVSRMSLLKALGER